MRDAIIGDATHWSYPSVHSHQSLSDIQADTNQIEALKCELNELKQTYIDKIAFANRLISDLQNIVPQLNSELISFSRELVKKITLKLIGKELQADPELIHSMVDELIKMLPPKQGMATVYLSEKDAHAIHVITEGDVVGKIDPELKPGDIVIKSNYAQIEAKLMNRIDLLLKDHHE